MALYTNQGKLVNPKTIPWSKHRDERERFLVLLVEVLGFPTHGHKNFFNVEKRARLGRSGHAS